MAVPTGYTEDTLKAYMNTALGAVATTLGWTVALGNYDEPLNEALLRYGTVDVTSISGISNIIKIRALARREVWAAVLTEVSSDYDFEDESGRNDRSQVFRMAKDNYARTVIESMVYDPDYEVTPVAIDYDDPYQAYDENDDT